jgi:selenocysteine-specific elongation factor
VDRVFTLRGIGTVVTGTTTGGIFRRGEEVVVQSSGAHGKIRSVQNHNREVEFSPPGTRTALNIPDVKGAPIQRGDVITRPEFGEAVKEIDARLEKSERLINTKVPAARPLKDGTRVRIHLGSADVAAHVILNQSSLQAGEKTIARIRFEAPVFAFTGDRFIVRDWSEQATLAGGIVLDADPPPESLKSASRLEFLDARAAAPDDLSVLVLSEIRRFRAVRENKVLAKSRFHAAEIIDALTALERTGKILRARGWAIDHAYWDQLLRTAASRVDAEHRAHPNRPGISSVDFKTPIVQELPSDDLLPVFLEHFGRTGFTISSNLVRRSNHLPSLPPKLQSAGQTVRSALSTKRFDPPSRKEVAPDASTQEALRFLLETGEAILLSEEVVLLADAIQQAAEIVRSFLRQHRAATASELRQALGTSRRVIIPLLEYFDRQGITRRDGDKRIPA